ncbi:MAG: PDGLE domain-containing protein [Anaerolineae bacterium]
MRDSRWVVIGLVLAVVVTFFSPLASPHPDGLERVAEDKGFIEEAQDAPYEIAPDYILPGVENEAVSTIGAGIVGVLVVFALVWIVGRALSRREERVYP